MKKILASAAIVGVLLVAAPTAAFADYTPSQSMSTYIPDGNQYGYTFTLPAPLNSQPDGLKSVTVSGGGSITIVPAATSTPGQGRKTGDSIAVALTFPTTATGAYTVSVGGTTIATLTSVQLETLALPDSTTSTTSGLAATGFDAAPYLWFGAGALALGAGLVAVAAVTRKRRDTESAA